MAVIELGVLHGEGDEPAVDAPRRPLDRRDLRRVLVALVTAFCVLTVTGSARPDPHGLRQLWSTAFDQGGGTFIMSADSIFVLNQLGTDQLTAYDLRTGAVRWSHPGPDDATWLSDIKAGVILLPAGLTTAQYVETDGSTITRDFNRDTVAVDARTGRQLWRESGELIATVGDRAVLTEWNAAGDNVSSFRTVRLGDGGTVWSSPARHVRSWITDTGTGAIAERLVTITETGSAEVLDLDDGSLVATAMLPWRPESSQESDFTAVTLEGTQLYLDRTKGDQSTITAYDTETLRSLWSIEQTAPGGIYGCGPVLCLSTTTRTSGHDRRTGAQRWQISGAANGFPLLDGVLMVDDDDETGTRHHLIEAATGHQIADLGSAVPVWNYQLNRTPYVVAHAERSTDLMLISRVDEKSGEVLLRGTLPAVLDYGCQTDDTLVACITQDDRLIVTDVG
jgi:outer membrane protein assembly factor BamB